MSESRPGLRARVCAFALLCALSAAAIPYPGYYYPSGMQEG